MPDKFVLTDENYYTREADIHYMSCSQYQSFQKCEAATIAKLMGIWIPEESSEALFQGQYFHCALESTQVFEKFCDDNFDKIFKVKITKAKGTEIVGKYAPFILLDKMLNVVRTDPVMSRILEMPGENELFMTGSVGAIPWRMKMDKYTASRMIVDYKTSANIWETHYNPSTKERETFVEHYGYMMRAAVYGEIERQNTGSNTYPPFLILAVSKQDPPDRAAIYLNDDERWNLELEEVKRNVQRMHRLKLGELNPRRCGICEYCRKTKTINRIMMYTDLMPEFRNDPDNVEYDDYGGKSVFDTL